MSRLFGLVFGFSLFVLVAGAEPDSGHVCDSDHGQCGMYEFGTAVGVAYLSGEEEYAPTLHLHCSRRLASKGWASYFSLGVGGEVIFAEHDHYALVFPLAVYPWKGLILAVAPGVEWVKHEGEPWESGYATHLEAAYVFEIGRYDVGPVFEYSNGRHEDHYMVGVHLGLHF